MKFFIFAFAFSLAASARAFDIPSSKTYGLEIHQGSAVRFCSTTLVKDFSSCHLVTNFHCVRSPFERIEIISGWSGSHIEARVALPRFQTENQATVVIKSDAGKDLVELQIPGHDNWSIECAAIEPLQPRERDVSQPFATVGFVRGQARSFFSGGTQGWASILSPGQFSSREGAGLSRLKYFSSVADLKSERGMSGGAGLDVELKMVGLITRLIEFENKIFLIPNAAILDFLRDPSTYEESEEDARLYKKISCLRNPTAGDNEHGTGGDCASADTNSSSIEMFHEGVERGSEVILSINESPILGESDYQRQTQLFPRGKIVKRPKGEWLPLKERNQVLDRLVGKFFAYSSHTRESRYKVFVESPTGKKEVATANPNAFFHFQKKTNGRFGFLLQRTSANLTHVGESSSQWKLPPAEYSGELEYRNDAKEIVLSLTDGRKLICPNLNFSRIVCQSDQITFVFGRHPDLDFEFKWIERFNKTEVRTFGAAERLP